MIMTFICIAIINLFIGCADSPTTNTATANANATAQTKQAVDNSSASTVTEVRPARKGGPAEIVVNVKNMVNPKASLIGYYAESHYTADTAAVNNGKFVFKNSDGYDQGLYFISIGQDKFAQVLLADDQKFTISLDAMDPINTIVVKGSEENELFYDNLKYEQDLSLIHI